MLNTYFIHIAAVRMAAALTGRSLYDNYAFHGALGRFASLDIGTIREADGIDDMPVKADSFIFGQRCGRVLTEALKDYDAEKLFLCEAAVAKGVFMKLTPEASLRYTQEQLKEIMKTVLRALFKYAQIQTHTAKPGGEDINKWLNSYDELRAGFEPSLAAFADVVISPDAGQDEIMTGFFDREERLTALALGGIQPDAGALKNAMAAIPTTAFGIILKNVVSAVM